MQEDEVLTQIMLNIEEKLNIDVDQKKSVVKSHKAVKGRNKE